jgi:hypothetical protein
MPIVITDDDAERLLSIPEAIEAMRVAFRDLALGRAANPPRVRYSVGTPDPARRYIANVHAGAVESYAVACVRAGSNFTLTQEAPDRKSVGTPDDVNWTIIILYDLKTGEPIAFMHETHLSRSISSHATTPRCSGCSAPAIRPCPAAARSARCGRSGRSRSTAPIRRTGAASSSAWRARRSR